MWYFLVFISFHINACNDSILPWTNEHKMNQVTICCNIKKTKENIQYGSIYYLDIQQNIDDKNSLITVLLFSKHTIWLLKSGLGPSVVGTLTILGSHPYIEPVVFQWQSSGNPVCLELRPQCTLECHWRNNFGSQCASSGLPVAFQWSHSVFQLCKLTLDRHWDTTGC